MSQIRDLLKVGLLQYSINSFATDSASHTYIKQYIERIPGAHNLQLSTVIPRANTMLINTPRENSSRGTQRENSTIIHTIASNETGWIKMTSRSYSCLLPFLVGGVQLCKHCTILGRVCARQGGSFPKSIHKTFQQFSQLNKETVRH